MYALERVSEHLAQAVHLVDEVEDHAAAVATLKIKDAATIPVFISLLFCWFVSSAAGEPPRAGPLLLQGFRHHLPFILRVVYLQTPYTASRARPMIMSVKIIPGNNKSKSKKASISVASIVL
jgi:hypothetical protein